jgi:hypothetical protein
MGFQQGGNLDFNKFLQDRTKEALQVEGIGQAIRPVVESNVRAQAARDLSQAARGGGIESFLRGQLGSGIIPGMSAIQSPMSGTSNFGRRLVLDALTKSYMKYAEGGRIGYALGDRAEDNAMQASGIMNLPLNQNPAGVTELDLRDSGGFIPPVGVKEKADDIPAMLSNNEFVFTADAVRGMGDGDVNKGAQRMYRYDEKIRKRRKSLMAETITQITQPPEFIEAAAKPYITELQQAVGGFKEADLSKTMGPQFVAGLSPLQQQAMGLAGGLGAYQPYLTNCCRFIRTNCISAVYVSISTRCN